ncbi:MAG: hypothetical protein V2A54_11090 [Bacteroidota bacterium]
MRFRWQESAMIRSKRIACVELHFTGEETYESRLTIIEKAKGELKILAEKESDNAVASFKSIIPSGAPLFLALSGKGILIKKEKTEEGETRESILQRILPNAAADELIFQIVSSRKADSMICVTRKTIIDKANEIIKPLKASLAHIFLGPSPINPLMNYFHDEKNISIGYYSCSFSNSEMTECSVSEKPESGDIKIEGEKIPYSRLIALGCGQQYFGNELFKQMHDPFLKPIHEEYLHGRFIKSFGAACLVLIFAILLGNYFLFESYKKKLDSISGEVTQYDELFGKLDTLTNNLQEKKQFLEKSGLLSPSRISFYADRLAASLPAEIKLTRMNLQPVELNEDNKDDAMKLKTGCIVITGTTGSSVALNNWIRIIKSYEWAGQVLLQSYMQESLPNPAVFNLEIILK